MKYLNVFFIAGILLLVSCKDKIQDKENIPMEHNVPERLAAAGPECFLKVVGRDSIMFMMERDGDSVRGVFNWKPYEKDIKLHNFKGTLINGKGEAIAQVSAEGMNTTEELDFTVQDNTVTVKFGVMEQGRDGIWHYKPGEPVSEHVLPKTDCPGN